MDRIPIPQLLLGLAVGFGGFALSAQTSAAPTTDAKPAPDVLTFTNGDRLTGTLERSVGDSVLFKSDMAGELTIPFSKIRELHSGTQFAVIRKHEPIRGLHAVVGTVDLQPSELTVTRIEGQNETLATDNVGFIISREKYEHAVLHSASPWEGWSGTATGGVTLVRATQTATTLTAAVNLVRTVPIVPYLPSRNRTIVNATESYGRQRTPVIPQTAPPTADQVVLTNIFHADGERDEYFNRRVYALGDVSFDHNYAQGLQLQQVYGLGLGWTPLKSGVQQLDLKADAHYEKQEFRDAASNQNLFGSTFSEAYHRSFPHKIIFTENVDYLPAWTNLNAYSANLTAILSLPLFKSLGVSLTTTDNYLNNPSPGYKKNALQFVTGVTYTLP